MEPLRIERMEKNGTSATLMDPIRINGYPAMREPFPRAGEDKIAVQVTDPSLQHILGTYPLDDLRTQLWSVRFSGTLTSHEVVRNILVTFWQVAFPIDLAGRANAAKQTVVAAEPPIFEVVLSIDVADWARPWTPREYAYALDRVVQARLIPGLMFGAYIDASDAFAFSCEARSLENTLGDEMLYWAETIRSIHEEATTQLVAAQHADSLTTTFHFPRAIATACEQYLLYFVQFLADLGIDAEADVQHTAAEVLFRVTPTEGREALERVREALDAYLQLPTDPSFAVVAAQETDLAVRQLEANVFHLQGQLSIAKAVLQAKDAQIEALELSNFRLRQIGGGEVQVVGRENAAPATGEATEAVIPGIVSVKDVEKGGVVLHTPEIVRRLKRRFGW